MSSTRIAAVEPRRGTSAMADVLASLERAADELALVDLDGVGDSAALDGVRRLSDLSARLTASRLALVAEVDRRGAARRATGATSTAAWLRTGGMAAGAAVREVQLAD